MGSNVVGADIPAVYFRQLSNIDFLEPDVAEDHAIETQERKQDFWKRYIGVVRPDHFIAHYNKGNHDDECSTDVTRLNSPKPIEDVTSEVFSTDKNPLAQFLRTAVE